MTAVCQADKVCEVLAIVAEELARHAHTHISVHRGKTQVWNRNRTRGHRGAHPTGRHVAGRRRMTSKVCAFWECPSILQRSFVGSWKTNQQSRIRCSTGFPDGQQTSALALAVDVRGNEGEFLASCSSPGANRTVCRASRHQRVEVSPNHSGIRASSGQRQGCLPIAILFSHRGRWLTHLLRGRGVRAPNRGHR